MSNIRMTKSEYVEYWKNTAENDWGIVEILFEKRRYLQALFFGQLEGV